MNEKNQQRFGLMVAPALVALLAAAFIMAGAWAVWQWQRPRDVALSQAPAFSAASFQAAPGISTIALQLHVPLTTLQQTLDDALPLRFDFAGSGRKSCIKLILRHKLCATPTYNGQVQRDGPASISASGSRITISLPLSITGAGGISGRDAQLLQLNGKKFRASVIASLTASVALDRNWCPLLQDQAGFRWQNPAQVEILGGVWLDIAPVITQPLQTALAKAAARLPRAIRCAEIRDPLARAWHGYAIPVKLPGADLLYANIQPTGLGFSGITADGAAIGVTARLTAQTMITTAAIAPSAIALPALAQVPYGPGAIALEVPVEASYGRFDAIVMQALGGRAFTENGARITITSVIFYPSGPRLVAKIAFTARTPARWFDSSGVVYLSGVPVVASDGHSVMLRDVAFSRLLDNPLWNELSLVFQDQIQQALTQAAVLDLTGAETRAGTAITGAISNPRRTGGIQLSVGKADLSLKSIVLTNQWLVATVALHASLSGVLTPQTQGP